jgi:hypothetical protein
MNPERHRCDTPSLAVNAAPLCGFSFTFALDVGPFRQSLAAEWQHTFLAMLTANNPPNPQTTTAEGATL